MVNVTSPALPPLDEYVHYLKGIWERRWLTNDGELVQLLGRHLEKYLKTRNLVLVSNGTIAIELALRALDIEGEVITTPFTFSATTNTLLWRGLTPIFVDIDRETFNLSPDAVAEMITKKTSAILGVHVYGNPCDVKAIDKIAEEHQLKIIYDAAHAFGVEYDKVPVISYGNVATLSFHATKVFNTIEGGAIVAKDVTLCDELKLLRNHGIKSEEEVVFPGTNAKMNEFQAAMGLCNLQDVNANIERRRILYERYKRNLSEIEGLSFQKLVASRYNYAYMPVLFRSKKERDNVYSSLTKTGIKPRKYFYPLTVDFDYFKGQLQASVRQKLTNAVEVSDRVLCLPLYPDLQVSQVDEISKRVEALCT